MFQKINQFFFLPSCSVSNRISIKAVHLRYITLDNLLTKSVADARHLLSIKRKIKNTFCNILVSSHVRWILEICKSVWFSTKNCPLFELTNRFLSSTCLWKRCIKSSSLSLAEIPITIWTIFCYSSLQSKPRLTQFGWKAIIATS